ncbi:hypothetical protein CCP3SC15_1110003 [Gammaproteobacteria bacterium]
MKWINTQGYTLVKDEKKSTWFKAIYEFNLSKDWPLTLVADNGRQYTPDRHYFTDMGSIPRFLQFLVPKDRSLAFFTHDSSYEFGGLYINGIFCALTREQADDLLYQGMLCDPIPVARPIAWLVWSQVRLWGKGNFNKRTDVPPEPPTGLDRSGPMPTLRQA